MSDPTRRVPMSAEIMSTLSSEALAAEIERRDKAEAEEKRKKELEAVQRAAREDFEQLIGALRKQQQDIGLHTKGMQEFSLTICQALNGIKSELPSLFGYLAGLKTEIHELQSEIEVTTEEMKRLKATINAANKPKQKPKRK